MKYSFPKMTSTVPEDLGELGKMREDLFKRYIRQATVQPALEQLTGLTIKAMAAIARGNFHPAARYNAVLILGMLDQKLATVGANPTPPVPLPDGTKELLDLLELEEFKDIPIHPAVKTGALEGLERHARFGIDEQHANRVKKVALDIIAQENPVPGVRKSVRHWIKCQAAGVLAYQFKAGPDAEVQGALSAMLVDDTMGLEDRCSVANYFGRIDYAKASGIDGPAVLAGLGGLTKDLFADEAEEARDYEEQALEGNAGIRPGRTFRRGRGKTEGPKYGRSRLLSRLNCVTKAAKSLEVGLDEQGKGHVQSLLAALDPLTKIVIDSKSLDLEVAGEVLKAEKTVTALVGSWAKPDEESLEDAGAVEEFTE